MLRSRLALLAWALLLTLTGPASARDWYVDAVAGSDANDGTSPTSAWRTITHGMAQNLPFGAQVFHVAAGTYDAALGEVFPIQMQREVSVIGAGVGATIVDLGSAPDAGFRFTWAQQLDARRLEGLSIVNGGVGVEVFPAWIFSGPPHPKLADLEIVGMSQAGIRIGAGAGTAALTGQRLELNDNAVGLDIYPNIAIWISETRIARSAQYGIDQHASFVYLARVEVVDGAGTGIRSQWSFPVLTLDDCLVARNAGDGVSLVDSYNSASVIQIERSTVVDNGGKGLATAGTVQQPAPFLVASSIVHGNGDDIDDALGLMTVTHSNIGDGDFAGTAGNLSADPRFADPAAGDYALAWGSPCVDAGDPLDPGATQDLVGQARDVDGDLDTVERVDMGCRELTTLSSTGSASLGGFFELTAAGPPGAATTVHWTNQGVVPPTATAFGEFDLAPNATPFLSTVLRPSGAPLYRRSIPNSTGLVGQAFAWQALTDSPAAPLGRAYTNPVQVTLVP